MIVAMIVIIIIIILFVIFLFKEPKSTKKTNKSGNKKAAANSKSNEDTKQNTGIKRPNEPSNLQKKDIFDFMEFDYVQDDMIIQNDGNRYTMIIQCKGINYDLMSSIEQLAVEEGFIVFLNTLKYPIQIYVQARSVDLKKSMAIYNERVKLFQKQYVDADEEFRKKMNTLDATEEEIDAARNERAKFSNIYEYAQDINKYVEKLSLNKNILQRKFYIAISYSRAEIAANNNFSKDEIYEISHRELYTRANSLINSLMTCSVVGRVLTSEELIELLFVSYNRDDERLFDITTALDSDFYRLYSTSKDIYDKKREMVKEEVEKEALERVRDAIKQTARQDELKTPEEIEDEFEEMADREAINIIREAEVDKETKEKLTNIIAENHVVNARERIEKRKNKLKESEKEDMIANESEESVNEENVNEENDVNKNIYSDTEEENDDDIIS